MLGDMAAEEARFVVNYIVGSVHLFQDEDAPIAPVIGHGLHHDGDFFRIIDVWYNREKHAPVPFGIVAFLERLADLPEPYAIVDEAYYAG